MLIISYVAFMLALICPESPRWYLVNGDRVQAIKAFNRIAELNGTKNRLSESVEFKEEAQMKQDKEFNDGKSFASSFSQPMLFNASSVMRSINRCQSRGVQSRLNRSLNVSLPEV